ncbi:MAG: hypothetical protein Q8934_15585 [Bacillota bacterium]|nr:hypothetical protein [Bacillota bacterium]
MFGVGRKKQDDEFNFDTNDLLVIFDDENKTSDIQRIGEIREGTIYVTGKYAIPYEDCEITTGTDGRNFFYRAPARSILETKRLAALEQSMVLNQITAYRPPVPPSSMDWTKGILFALIFVAFIIIGISSCGGGK